MNCFSVAKFDGGDELHTLAARPRVRVSLATCCAAALKASRNIGADRMRPADFLSAFVNILASETRVTGVTGETLAVETSRSVLT